MSPMAVALENRTVHAALAMRDVTVLSDMETIRASPDDETWVSFALLLLLLLLLAPSLPLVWRVWEKNLC